MTVTIAVLGLGSVGRGILEMVDRKPELGYRYNCGGRFEKRGH